MEVQKKWFAEATPQNAKKASVTIGSGADGSVTVEYDYVGDEGNDYTITVVEGSAGGNLNASISGSDITVTLGMTSPTKAHATIGSGTNGAVAIEVDTAGEAGNDYSVEVATGSALSAALAEGKLTITLATDGSTATAIASAINTSAGDTFTATASGTGETAITSAEAEKDFSGGADAAPSDVKNTATLIAAKISTLTDFTATASGEGTSSISAAESEAEFSGGQYGTVAIVPETILYISGVYYINLYPNSIYDDYWRTITFTKY